MASGSAPAAVSAFDGMGKRAPLRQLRAPAFEPDEWEWLQTPVSKLMTRKVVAVTADLRIEQLILLLIHENISGVPVVDASGRPIGIVSKTDLVADDYDWAELREEARRLNGDEMFVEHPFVSSTVADIMTSGALTAPETMTVPAAAALMADSHAHRLPIVNEADELVGIISTLDIARWVAERMETIG